MKILLTGATGLIGSNLAYLLPKKGYAVRAFVRESSNLTLIRKTGAEIFKGNLLNENDLYKAATGCQVVIHAAANTSQWPTSYEHYIRQNVEATRLLLEQSMKAGVERFLFVGSANAFGPGSKEAPGNESTPFTPAQFSSGYMRSKYEAQKLVLDLAQKHYFPVIVVNPCFMLGPMDLKPSSGKLILTAWRKRLIPYPPGGKNFIHAGDAAKAIINAIEKGKSGECYLLGNENLTYREFFQKMRKVCGYPEHLIALPRTAVQTAGSLGSFAEKLTGKAMPLNRVNARLLCAGNYYSAEKAIRELHLPQTSIEQAIQDTLSWFEKNRYSNQQTNL